MKKYYYANAHNQPTGPVDVEELRKLHEQGVIHPHTNVIEEGGQRWLPFSEVQPAALKVAPAVKPAAAVSPAPVAASASQSASSSPAVAASPAPTQAATAAANTPAAQSAQSATQPVQQGQSAQVNQAAPAAGISATTLLNGPTLLADMVGVMLEKVRVHLNETFVRNLIGRCTRLGQLFVLGGAVVGLLSCLIQAFKPNQLGLLFMGLGAVFAIAILQYVSKRFFEGCSQLIQNTPGAMASAAVTDCLGLACVVGALFVLIGGVISAFQSSHMQLVMLLAVLFASGVLVFLGAIFLNPRAANVRIQTATAGEEAMGIVSFFIRMILVLMPPVFFLLSLGAAFVCFGSLFFLGDHTGGYRGGGYDGSGVLGMVVDHVGGLLSRGGGGMALGGMSALAVASLLPFLAYVGFLLLHLLVDIIRAIVCLPGKVESLRNK